MPFVDPEARAALLSSIEANAKAHLDQPGFIGATARAAEAYRELTAWIIAEHERGTPLHDIGEAAAVIGGSFVASAALSIARPSAEHDVHDQMADRALTAGRRLMDRQEHHHFTPFHPGRRQ